MVAELVLARVARLEETVADLQCPEDGPDPMSEPDRTDDRTTERADDSRQSTSPTP